MTECAELVAAQGAPSRSCIIEITNVTSSHWLINPRIFLESGETYNPPQPTVQPKKTEICMFGKNKGAATGSVGVLAYELWDSTREKCNKIMVIMFSVPSDYNLYKNWFAVGIYPKDRSCDESLYKELYYEKHPKGFVREEANGSGILYSGDHLEIRATMCPMGKAIIKAEVWDKSETQGAQNLY
ncbi:actinoporin-like protein [Pholidichthys leucotaenia]